MTVYSKINPDLTVARGKVTFDVSEFTNWYHGGADKVKEKRFLGKASRDGIRTKLDNKFTELNKRITSLRIPQ